MGDVMGERSLFAAVHLQHMVMAQEYRPVSDLLIFTGGKVEPLHLLRELGTPPGFKFLVALHLPSFP